MQGEGRAGGCEGRDECLPIHKMTVMKQMIEIPVVNTSVFALHTHIQRGHYT